MEDAPANALAALALASAIGCPLAPMLHGLREYRGEPHRVEPVGVIDGIEAFDDSKGTNVGATVAATVLLTLPLTLEVRTVVALLCGPLVGIAVHLAALAQAR